MDETKYPRPRFRCSECEGVLVLCYGKVVKPYLRHLTNPCGASEESLQHQLAKILITDFLNLKRRITVSSFCHNCNTEQSEEVIPTEDINYKTEVTYKDSRFDVAGSKDGNIVYGIEINYKHKTTNTQDRNDVKWIELEAEEVIHKLCKEDIAEVSLLDKRKHICNGCKEYYIDTADYKKIAEKLGYYQNAKPYCCEARKIVDAAIRGKYILKKTWWSVDIDLNELSYEEKNTLKKIVKNGKCFKCHKECDISMHKLFCFACYRKIKKEEQNDQEGTWISIDPLKKQELRSKLSWLNKIKGGWRFGSPCSLCKKDYIDDHGNPKYWDWCTNYVQVHTWWFGDKKRICTICLQKEIDKRGIKL